VVRLPGVRLAVFVALGCGCGITVVGVLDPDRDGGTGGSEAGASLPDGGFVPDAPATDSGDTIIDIVPLDASFDVNPANCAAACDGGVCDGGWCTFTCGPAQCQNAPVVCPPGVPCAVACNANGSCSKGVNCGAATACDIKCKGDTSCINDKVTCTGVACTVKCSGNGSCNQGVECDAGLCAIGCTGGTSCINGAVQCRGDSCQVVCGDGVGKGKGSCNQGVSCIEAKSCDIACQDPDSCTNSRVTAVAGDRTNVRCTAAGACNSGIQTTSADDTAFCKDTACGQGIFCDGGACKARCANKNVGLCCKAGTCQVQSDKCTLMDTCP
jgi:hypothetical protein